MAYGTIKVDTVTFTNDGVDKSVTLSGLVQNPTFSGNVTVTGTLSGVTVTGTTASFTSGNFTNISGGTHTITSGVFAAGSAASPSITFTGDLNTGIYSPGVDQVAISTNGTRRLIILSDGKVGLGAASVLQQGSGVDGGSAAGVLELYNGGTGNTTLENTGAFPILFKTNGSERLRITSAGLVGVGTSSPSGRLTIANDSALNEIEFTGNDYTNVYSSTTQGFDIGISNGSSTGPLRLLTANTERLRITSAGNVGIGTTSPGNALHVNGSIQTGSTSHVIYSSNFGNYSSSSDLSLISGSASLVFKTGASDTERARIDTSGRLLVGTSSDLSGGGANTSFQLAASSGSGVSTIAQIYSFNSGGGVAALDLCRSKSTTLGTNTTVANNDYIGSLNFKGANGSSYLAAASVSCEIDGAVSGGGAADMPGRLVFSVTADGASTPTERMRITSNAYVRLASGTGGIQFNGDTAAANALNDYEEGTWTPTYAPSSGSFGSATYSSIRYGKYTKIGNLVACTFVIAMDALTYGTGTGNIKIAGLPFLAHASSASQAGNTIIGNSNSFYNCPTMGTVIPSSTEVLLLYRLTSVADPTNLDVIDMASSPIIEGNYISGCVVYTVS